VNGSDVGYSIELLGGPGDGLVVDVPDLPSTYKIVLSDLPAIDGNGLRLSLVEVASYSRTLHVNDAGRHRYEYRAIDRGAVVHGKVSYHQR